MIAQLAWIVLGSVGLFVGGNWLVKGASRLASSLGVSALIIGLTVVALGTSAPELLVSLTAALEGASGVTIGNVVGSNIANIGLILAVSGIIYPVAIQWNLLRREILFVIGFSLLVVLLSLDGVIGRLDGVVLMASYAAYTIVVYKQAQMERRQIEPELTEFEAKEGLIEKANPFREAVRLSIGLIVLVIGARLFVDGAVGIATELGISDVIIGLTLVAVGTSLPELVTSVIASRRRENDIVMGNVIGSNISNLLVILGIIAIIQPIPVGAEMVAFDMPVMIGFALLLLPLALRQVLRGWLAVALLGLYFAFILLTVSRV